MSEMLPPPPGGLPLVDHMLEELMRKHIELAGMCGDYRDFIADVEDRPWDAEGRTLARSLPGAKYHVGMTHMRELALKIEAELKKAFPEPPAG